LIHRQILFLTDSASLGRNGLPILGCVGTKCGESVTPRTAAGSFRERTDHALLAGTRAGRYPRQARREGATQLLV